MLKTSRIKERKLIVLFLFLALCEGIIIDNKGSFCQDNQEKTERPNFYAIQVACESNVQKAKDSLGMPDSRYAEISPGGQLTLRMGKNFVDSGLVVCKGEVDYRLEGWFQVQSTIDREQNYSWIIIQRESCNRFSFLPESYIWFGNTGVSVIRITNFGKKTLLVDAVVGYGSEAERR